MDMQSESLDGIHANGSRRGWAVNRSLPSLNSNPRFRGVRDLVACAGGLLCWTEAAWGQSRANNQLTNLSLHEAFFGVVVLGIVANAYLVGLFHPVSPGTGGICRRWSRKWELSPQDLGAFSWWRLALWSLLSLFFELLMIRWISSEIRVFAYFKNFVLIACFLGFGLGRHVTAVEIDPLILALGRKLHPENPYGSPLVRTAQDDARSYLQNSSDRFDLIVFSLLDSHTTSSHFSNIRIDNYVYTLEALQAAKKLLKADGIFIIKFQVDTPWIAGRLYGLLQSVFGHAPLQLEADSSYIAYTTGGRFVISGSEHHIQEALSDRRLAAYVAKHNDFQMSPASLTTDDWPYFYQHEPGLPASVLSYLWR